MIVDSGVQELISLRPGDEIVVANKEDYFRGYALTDDLSPTKMPIQYKEVCDIVKENGKLVILIK